MKASGVEFATVKATRGLNVTDEYLATDLPAARNAGLAVGPYHFYTGTAAGTGGAQADRFIAAVKATGYTGKRAGDLPPVFDLEWKDDGSGGCPPYVTVADAKAWLDKVQAAFGRTPIIYTQKSFLDACLGGTTALSAYPMQLADYRQSVTQPRAARRVEDVADVAVHRRGHPRRHPRAGDRGRLQRHPGRSRPARQPLNPR